MKQKYNGKSIDVTFDGDLCIHSRHCVLGLPKAFQANAKGDWIIPDNATAEELKRVIRNCPSGALQYIEKDCSEPLPEVNTVRVWENGPYAVQAQIESSEIDCGNRATLCRCGDSNNRPYCDGTHVSNGFTATGEPESAECEALDRPNGILSITPIKDGPLMFKGSVELIKGSGKTFNKVTQTALCRCGYSENKPYCDGQHSKVGFKS